MAEINLSKYGITEQQKLSTTHPTKHYSQKRPSQNWKAMKKVRKVNLAQSML